ncbi:DUF6455 family protein [Roseobacteraceae bacterium NS-SX3]
MKDTKGAAELGQFHRHFWLTRSVAAAAGTDLNAAMQEGRLSGIEFARMLARCREAGCGKTCALWLTTRAAQEGKAPDFCANRAALEALKAQADAGEDGSAPLAAE